MKSPSSSPNKPGAADPKFLKIVYRLIRELKTNPINPRLHSQKQIRQMASARGSGGSKCWGYAALRISTR
jgi:hypothetical protein